MTPEINEGDFYETIHAAIAADRHVEELKKILEDYELYKKKFADSFTKNGYPKALYTFRVTYHYKKNLWRDIAVLGSQKFLDLAEAIIDSMGWDNDHMHGFELIDIHPLGRNVPAKKLWSMSYEFFAPDWEDDTFPTYKTDEIHISDLDYAKYPKLKFSFDYGDDHTFDVELKHVKEGEKKLKKNFPILIDQRGVAPEQYPEYE